MIKTGQEKATATPKVLDAGKGIHIKCLKGTIYVGDYSLSARESIYLESSPMVHGEGRFCWLSI